MNYGLMDLQIFAKFEDRLNCAWTLWLLTTLEFNFLASKAGRLRMPRRNPIQGGHGSILFDPVQNYPTHQLSDLIQANPLKSENATQPI